MKKKSSEALIKISSLSIILCAFLSAKILCFRWLLPLLFSLLQVILFWQADIFSHQEKGSPKWRTYRFLIYISGCFTMSFYYVSSIQDTLKFDVTGYLLFLFILIFGNYAPKIPFNRTLGLRLPWTVSKEATWRYAHRILGLWSFPCALLYLIGMILTREELRIIAICLWFFIPSIASYQYSTKKEKM